MAHDARVDRRSEERNGVFVRTKNGHEIPQTPRLPYRSGLNQRELRRVVDEVVAEELRDAGGRA